MIAQPQNCVASALAWRKIPPGVQASIVLLCEKRHIVAVRRNRNGTLRYSVDGKREMDAATMARIYKLDG
jgi:hypothetical protein